MTYDGDGRGTREKRHKDMLEVCLNPFRENIEKTENVFANEVALPIVVLVLTTKKERLVD